MQSDSNSVNVKRNINPSKSVKRFSIISNNHNHNKSFTNYNSNSQSCNTKPPHLTYGINYKRQNSLRGPNSNRIVYVKSSKQHPLENVLQKHQRDINGIIITSNLKSVNTERCNTSNNNHHKKVMTDIKMVVSRTNNSSSSSEDDEKDNNEMNQQTTQDKDSNSILTSKRMYQQQLLRNSLILPQNIILDQVINNTDKIYIKDIQGELFYNKKVIINAAGLMKKPSKSKTKRSSNKKPKNNFIISSFRRDGVTYFSNGKNEHNVDYLLNYSLCSAPEGSAATEKKTPLLKFKIELSQKNLKYYFKPLSFKADKQLTPFNEIEKIENDSCTFYLKITKRIVILKRKVQTLLRMNTFIFISDIQSEIISITKFDLNKQKEWQRFYNRAEIIGKEESSQRQNNDDSSEFDDVGEDPNIKDGKTSKVIRDKHEEKRIYFDKDGSNNDWYLGYNKIFHAWYLDIDGSDYSNLDNAWEACDNEVEIKNELVVKIGENVFKIYK